MTEALWAQIISGFFGVLSAVLVAYLPRRSERRRRLRNGGAVKSEKSAP